MASGGSQSDEVQKRLEDEITCPVCQDHFQEPKILPCLHYYCKLCIQSLALRAGDNRPFACPECRNDTLLPQNDSDRLPTAFFVNRMKELHTKMEKAEGKVEALCEQCSGGKATAFCRHCTEFICEECVKSHQKLKVFKGHKVTGLEELKKGETKEILIKKPPPPTCKVHEEEMKIYCFDCDRLICRDCTMIDHKEHKYDFVKTSAPKTLEKLVENLAPLKEIQLSLSGAAKTVKSTKSDIEAQGASVAITIEKSFDEIHEIIEQRKRQLLERAASVTKGKVDRLSIQEKGFEMASATIQSLVDFVEQNIENGTEEELMTIHSQVLKRINEETRKHKCSDADLQPVEKPNLIVQVDCGKAVKKVIEEKASLIECSVECSGIRDAEVGKAAFVRVSCKSLNPVSIESKLTSVHGTVQAKVQRKGNNVYEIEYIPKVRGRHNLEVTANGLPVPGSPYPVFVKIPPTQLGKPVKIIGGVKEPIGIAINSAGNIIVAEHGGGVKVLDKNGKNVHTIEKAHHGFKCLQGITVDKDDNSYLTDCDSYKLYKFNRHHELVKVVGREQDGLEEFNPSGVTVTGDKVVVGSRDPPCLYIFDKELDLDRKVDLLSVGVSDVMGIASDEHMNLYICNYNDSGVRVLSLKGQGELLYSFGQEQLQEPHSICVSSGLVYVTDWTTNEKCKTIFVFSKEGKFVTSFVNYGFKEGQCSLPGGLVVDADGVLYVCDRLKNRLQLF